MHTQRIKAVIFDWAGIFCTPGELFSHPRLLKTLKMVPEEIEKQVKKTQDEYYRGKISNTAFWRHIFKTFSLKGFTPKELNKAYLGSYKISRQNLQIPLRLKKNYSVALLSNLTGVMMSHIVKIHTLKNRFHKLFFSNRMGFIKPEEEIFKIALKQIGVRPEEAVFIDDSKKNLEAAKKMGMHTLYCPTPKELQRILKQAKLL